MVEASELIARALETSGLSRADLARELKVSRAEITERLKGERNITVRKLAETLHVMGFDLTLGSTKTTWHAPRHKGGWQLSGRPSVPHRSTWMRPESSHVR